MSAAPWPSPCWTGNVYLASARRVGVIKVGHTNNQEMRDQSLRTMSPVPLLIEVEWPGGRVIERWLICRFRPSRSHGDWFYITDEIERDIQTLRAGRSLDGMPAEPQRRVHIPGLLLRHYRVRLFKLSIEEMAAAMDCKPRNWAQRERTDQPAVQAVEVAYLAARRGIDLSFERILADTALLKKPRA